MCQKIFIFFVCLKVFSHPSVQRSASSFLGGRMPLSLMFYLSMAKTVFANDVVLFRQKLVMEDAKCV
ncbi:MAG: hypothetical protein ACI9T7_003579 [Oleiphilaceae bacterium]|jgi:hypothetical protein